MSTATFPIASRLEITIVWQRIDSASSRKWRKKVRISDMVVNGLESFDEAKAKMEEVEMFANVTNTTSSKVGDSSLWQVNYTVTIEEWENLGRYIGGIYQGT